MMGHEWIAPPLDPPMHLFNHSFIRSFACKTSDANM